MRRKEPDIAWKTSTSRDKSWLRPPMSENTGAEIVLLCQGVDQAGVPEDVTAWRLPMYMIDSCWSIAAETHQTNRAALTSRVHNSK
jgi:hypothetical protein